MLPPTNRKPEEDGAARPAVDAGTGERPAGAVGGPVQETWRTAPVKVGNVVAALHMDGTRSADCASLRREDRQAALEATSWGREARKDRQPKAVVSSMG